MSIPFNKESRRNFILREEDIINMLKDTLVSMMSDKDTSISDAELEARNLIQDTRIKALEDKPDRDKIYDWVNPFYIKVPKTNDKPILVEVEGVTRDDKLMSFAFRLPISFFNDQSHKPHIVYANENSIKILKSFHYGFDTTSNTRNNIFGFSVPELVSGVVTVASMNTEAVWYDTTGDVTATTLFTPSTGIRIEPDNGIEKIEDPHLLVRSRTAKWIEFLTQSEYLMLVANDATREDTAYATTYSTDGIDFDFSFNTKEEAKAALDKIYPKIKDDWHRVVLRFPDEVTDLSGLFEGVDHKSTVGKIYAKNVTNASNLYKDSMISSISPDLFSGMPNLVNLDRAFYDCDNLERIPEPNVLFYRNKNLETAQEIFAECDKMVIDPNLKAFHVTKDDGSKYYPNMYGYISKETDPIAPYPWGGYSATKVYPNNYDVKSWWFATVEQFKKYYKEILPNKQEKPIPDLTLLNEVTITIAGNSLDEMFMGTNVVKLPKYVKAVVAKTATRFAKDVKTLDDTNSDFSNIFLYNEKMESVIDAFNNTSLTKGFELIGASDTIENYSGIFKDCTSIDQATLPYPWRWVGIDGYPDDIIGIDGYKNIPNLPEFVPVEWGGPGTVDDTNVISKRSQIPIVERMYIEEDYILIDFNNKCKPGDILEVALVNPNNRLELTSKDIYKYTLHSSTKFIVGIGDKTIDGHHKLRATDCIRLRFREKSSGEQKVFSEYVYQTAYEKPSNITKVTDRPIYPLGIMLKEVD